jgi:hypothetical protein
VEKAKGDSASLATGKMYGPSEKIFRYLYQWIATWFSQAAPEIVAF